MNERMKAEPPPLSKEDRQRQFDCGQCMQLMAAELARLVESASADLNREQAVAIIRDWAETRRKQDVRQQRAGRGK